MTGALVQPIRQLHQERVVRMQRKEITVLIENEICGRYYYLNGKIEKSLENDPLAIKAIELLNNPQGEYKELLTKK